MMEQTDHQVIATAVDPTSMDDKESAKLDMQYRMKFKPALDYIEKSMGIDRSGDYVPDSVEELNLYEGAGGFKLSKETKIEQGIDYTFYISDWKETKKKLIRDFCTINCAGTKDYTDQYTKKVRVRYVNPAVLISQYSRYWDHRNVEFAGEIIQVLVADLRKLNPDIPEEILLNLAREYNGICGNVAIETLSFNTESKTGNYDSFLVDVVDGEWMSVNSEYKTKRKTAAGNEILYDDEWGKMYDTEKKKTTKYDIKVVYKCKWIIGTDYTYDFGLQYDIPRPGKKEVELSYHLYKLPYRSITSLSETYIHQFCLTYFRLQNAIAMAAPPGIAVEFTSLQNMKLGANKLQPLELFRIRNQTGNLLFKATTHKGIPNTPSGYKPIQELTGGIGPQLVEFLKIFEYNLNAIREVTGINQAADASNPDPNAPVGTSNMEITATNNALRSIYTGYLALKEQSAKNISLRLQLLIKHDKEAYKGYMPVLGNLGVQIISVGADVVDADYYIKYEAKPTKERRDIILKAANDAMMPDRDGLTGIELPDFLMIERLLEGGNLKYAEAYLNYKSKKNRERHQQLQRENMQLDKQREQEAIQVKMQQDDNRIKAKEEADINVYRAKKMIDDELAQKQHEREKELLQMEAALGMVGHAVKKHVEENPSVAQ
jgi:hypothetical protein